MAADQCVSVGASIAVYSAAKVFVSLVSFEYSSVPSYFPTAYDVFFFKRKTAYGM